MKRKRLALVLGIRPDVIRASILLQALRAAPHLELSFIWSGQHYSDNLKDVFFRELGVPAPDIELGAQGSTDAELVADIIAKLSPVLRAINPEAAVFLGDTNTVVGCLAAAQLNIPIVHIEGCMRSYDWRMPEEKYRTLTDHLSDVIYAYCEEYKEQGIAEGLDPAGIVVVGNLIVDVLGRYYFDRRKHYDELAGPAFFRARGLRRGEYYLMTCHRRENLLTPGSLANILRLVGAAPHPVYFPAGYRTQAVLKETGLTLPGNVSLVDPIGYDEMLSLMVNSRGVITDSGTVVEETCVLQVPSLQMRKSTERPQVYDAASSVKFDPARPEAYPAPGVFRKLEALHGKTWRHNLGDGNASQRIVDDLSRRILAGELARHKPGSTHLPTTRSYREDGLPA